MSGSASQQGPDWLGLLQWSLKYQDGTSETVHNELSEEKKAYLEKVFNEMTVNEPERLHVLCNVLIQYIRDNNLCTDSNLRYIFDAKNSTDGNKVSEDDMEDALDECEDIVGQIDMATGFVTKYNGVQYLSTILLNCGATSGNYALRCKVAGLMAVLNQNNDAVLNALSQFTVITKDTDGSDCRLTFVELLFSVYREITSGDFNVDRTAKCKLCSKIISVLSSLTSHVPFQKSILSSKIGINADGDHKKTFGLTELLLHAINSDNLGLVKRSILLANTLVGNYSSNRTLCEGEDNWSGVKITRDPNSNSGSTAVSEDLLRSAVTDEDLTLLASVFVPTCLLYLNHSIAPEAETEDLGFTVLIDRMDVCEASLRYFHSLSATALGKNILRSFNQDVPTSGVPSDANSVAIDDSVISGFANDSSVGTGRVIRSVIVNCLVASLKAHQSAIDRAGETENDHTNVPHLESEIVLLKEIMYNILATE